MRTIVLAGAALVLVVALSPSAVAHAAPEPPLWMKRVLHDFNDDWGSDASQGSPQDGHDLVALDVQEKYDTALDANVLIFRLTMNFGYDADNTRPTLKDVLTFKADGRAATYEFTTTNNQDFQGTFDAVSARQAVTTPDGKPDGSRFFVEGTLRYDTLGVKVGDRLTDYFVQGYGGSQKADHMLGGYTLGGQTVNSPPPSESCHGCQTSYPPAPYRLQGPTMYVDSNLDKTSFQARAGQNTTLTWRIRNDVGRTQTIDLTSHAPPGVEVWMHMTHFQKDGLRISLEPGVTATVHVYVTPDDTAPSGPIRLTALTSLGGRNIHEVQMTRQGSGPAPGTSDAPAPESPSKGSPGLGVVALLVAALVAVRLATPGRRP